MAVCVIGPVMDTDDDTFGPACAVHCCWSPCPHNGKPAVETPQEITPEPSREAALAFWESATRRQRPLVMHRGSWRDKPFHSGRDCWCGAEFFPAVEVLS
jgi:hypothetical protein